MVVAVVLDNPIVISHQPVVLVVEMVGIILVIPLLQRELQGRDIQVVLDPLIIILVGVVELLELCQVDQVIHMVDLAVMVNQ